MILTDEMHDAVVSSPVGRFIDRLIRDEVARGGDTSIPGGTGGNVIQQFWVAFGGQLMLGPKSFQSSGRLKHGASILHDGS